MVGTWPNNGTVSQEFLLLPFVMAEAVSNLSLQAGLDGAFALFNHEIFWRDSYTWLLDKGYRLRPRYDPSWVPSWKLDGKTGEDRQKAPVSISGCPRGVS